MAESVASLGRELLKEKPSSGREAQMEKVVGYKCSDSFRDELSNSDFPSRQHRQNREMAMRKEQAA